jgi:hypothetical protein
MASERQFIFTRKALAELCGITPNAVTQHIIRGYLDPEDLESIVVYLARYAKESLREKIVIAAIRRNVPADPGGWKAARGEKKKAPGK